MAPLRMAGNNLFRKRPQASLGPIPLNGVSNLAARRKPDPGCAIPCLVRKHLQHKTGRGSTLTRPSDTHEIRTPLQTVVRRAHAFRSIGWRSGRKPLAASRTAPREDCATAGCRHPAPEPVASLTDKTTGLIGTFHGGSPNSSLKIWPLYKLCVTSSQSSAASLLQLGTDHEMRIRGQSMAAIREGLISREHSRCRIAISRWWQSPVRYPAALACCCLIGRAWRVLRFRTGRISQF